MIEWSHDVDVSCMRNGRSLKELASRARPPYSVNLMSAPTSATGQKLPIGILPKPPHCPSDIEPKPCELGDHQDLISSRGPKPRSSIGDQCSLARHRKGHAASQFGPPISSEWAARIKLELPRELRKQSPNRHFGKLVGCDDDNLARRMPPQGRVGTIKMPTKISPPRERRSLQIMVRDVLRKYGSIPRSKETRDHADRH